MLSIIIADDEIGVIDLVKMLIDYPGAQIIGEAHNGLELLDKIMELHPNTVITDICMPGMTGLELIQEARKTAPEVNFIVMSGYTDFEYVQSALRLGCWDYLLKPIQKADLNRILKKLDVYLDTGEIQKKQSEDMKRELRESRSELRENYLRDVLRTGQPQALPCIGDKPLFAWKGRLLLCLALCADSQFQTGQPDDRLASQCGDEILEYIETHPICRELDSFRKDGILYCLLQMETNTAEQEIDDFLAPIRDRIRQYNNQSRFVRLSGGVSLPCGADPEGQALTHVFAQARAALKQRLERREEALISYDKETAFALELQPGFSQGEALQKAILRLDAEEAAGILLTAWKQTPQRVPGYRYRLTEELLSHINEAFTRLPGDALEQPLRMSMPYALSAGYSAEKIAGQIEKRLRSMMEEYREAHSQRENSMVVKAKQYVNRHFQEEISLNDVARHVCLSAAYFSSLFKNETGQGFVKYLQSVRIDRAKELLKSSQMSVESIAQDVGYKDIKFFKKLFRNETGVTPSEYRKFYS